jgi:hypothetical protein
MSIKKLCSIGLLNIKLNLTLRKTFAENNNFDINEYNSIEDLERLFRPNVELNSERSEIDNNYIDYINLISLSSDDDLLNTLFFINRAYQTKTFIEFLIPNEIKFNKSKFYFLKNLINEILSRNYFFVVENNIINESSQIKLIIKIIKDDSDEIIDKKEFDLIEEKDNIEKDIFNNEYFETSKLNFDFNKSDFFLIDLDSLKSLRWKTYKDLTLFLLNIIKNTKVKIILSINENSLIINNKINIIFKYNKRKDKYKNSVYEVFDMNKKIIEFSDIIFCFKNSINEFLRCYSIKNKTKIIKLNETKDRLGSSILNRSSSNPKSYSESFLKTNNEDLIIYDNNKLRRKLPRLSLVLDDFDYLNLYVQEFDDCNMVDVNIEPYSETFCFSLLNKMHTNKEFKENIKFLSNNKDKCFHIFIAGFLSRYINNIDTSGNADNYEECFMAGNLLLKNYLVLLKNNIDYITDVDEYNVIVPKIKKCLKERLYKQKREELRKIRQKEQKFVLDCINTSKSQKKYYNSLLDANCIGYLTKKNIMNHLTQNNLINQDGKVLLDPSSPRRQYDYYQKNKTSKLNFFRQNKIYKHNHCPTPLIENNANIPINFDHKKLLLKKIPDTSKDKKIFTNINNSLKKIGLKNSSYFEYNNKFQYNKSINANRGKLVNIRLPFTNKIKKSIDVKSQKNMYKTNLKCVEHFNTTFNSQGKDYIEYLFKLYQPKKNYKNFINNYDSNSKLEK